MRAFTRWTGAAIVAALIAPAGSSARADELVVMPYSCTMVGGQPLLTRAPEQGHRIIGRREQRTFSACSPANPQMCRNWTVHRFDIDCDRTRVSWVDVVAAVAAEYGTGQAWSDNGRLMLRMPRNWSFEPDDPCARPPGMEDRFLFGRMRRYCNDRSRLAPPVVEMPAGFAPMLGMDAIFVQSAPGAAASHAAPSPVPSHVPLAEPQAAAPMPSPPTKVTRAEPPPRPESAPHGRGEAQPTDAPAKIEAPPQAMPQPLVPAAKPAPTAPPAVQATRPPQAAPLPAAPGGPVVPKIINRPDGSEPSQPSADAAPQQASAPPQDGSSNAAPPAKHAAPPAPDPAAAAGRDSPAQISLLSFARSPTAGAIAALGGLAAVMVAVFAVARRRERIQAGSPLPHEFASVSLGGTPRGNLVPQPGAAPRRAPPAAALPVPTAPPRAQAPQPQAGVSPALVERIPQTRAEAIQMLGVGVSAGANEQAMKKIVDGLRLAWHPDLARGDADRQLREFRIKQINAAWDLIQGRRMERLDS